MKRLFISLAILAGISLSSCNDSFLEKTPVTDLTENNAFNSYDNFKAFMWPCYEMFTNNTIRTSLQGFGQDGQYKGDMAAGYFQQKYESGYNEFAYQTVASVASGNGWDFKSFIRRVNIMLSHIDNSSMTEAQKDHWRAVGYFFHSFWYMELIDRFGDVPWVDQVLQEDSPEAYGPRVDRKTVADKVLEHLQWAEQNIGNFTSQDGDNTINQDCVRAVISRFGLREGTWRKYHELGDAEKYLQECVRASELLMAAYPTLYTGTDGQPGAGYGEMWTTEDLGQVPGIILYKSYVKDINPMGMSYIEHTSSHYVEMNQNTVDLYLMKNGKPILADGSGYHGNKDMYAVFRDRDPRLYQTVADSLRIMSAMGTNYTEGTSPTGYPTKKFLNDEWWVAGLDYCTGRLSPVDAPCIRYAEVLLNYVEARYEIAQVGGNVFSQSDLDKSINELRDRQLTKWGDTEAKTMPKVQLNGGNLSVNGGVINDPARDPDVNPVLWEIRRERRIELIMEGRRGEDLRRWAKFEYLNSEDANGYPTMSFLGAYVNMADYPEISSKDDSGKSVLYLFDPENPGNVDTEKGYIYYLREKVLRTFKAGELNSERYYLRAIPAAQLTIYENKGQVLTQNPGW